MFNIGQFFKKAQNKHTQELFIRSTIKDAIQKQTNIEIPIEAISFTSQTLILKGISQGAKSQIFIKKQLILQEINTKQNIRKILDVR